VFTLAIETAERRNGVLKSRTSAFHLIDLAGSERQKSTGATGDRLREASQINKSLSSLAGVIGALVDIAQGKTRHVHYRDSKLTYLLRDSLGGNSKTSVVATVSPSDECYPETLATLKFAESAKLIKNKAVINENTTGSVAQMQAEIKALRSQLVELRCTWPPRSTAPRAHPHDTLATPSPHSLCAQRSHVLARLPRQLPAKGRWQTMCCRCPRCLRRQLGWWTPQQPRRWALRCWARGSGWPAAWCRRPVQRQGRTPPPARPRRWRRQPTQQSGLSTWLA
jgi:hypothetical protein